MDIVTTIASSGHRSRRRIAACALILILSWPAVAFAWANGPAGGSGYGTHDWVLDQAITLSARHGGASWVDRDVALAATDDPDTALHDFYHHVYDTTGKTYGDAPVRIEALFLQAVGELKSGDRRSASASLGLLSHYYADICNPMHTDQTPAEERVHSRYEDAVDDDTSLPGMNAAWITALEERPSSEEGVRAAAAAAEVNSAYAELVREFASRGRDTVVDRITREALNRAVNDVAAVIDDISREAGVQAAVAAESTVAVAATPTAPVTSSPQSGLALERIEARDSGSNAGPVVPLCCGALGLLALLGVLVIAFGLPRR